MGKKQKSIEKGGAICAAFFLLPPLGVNKTGLDLLLQTWKLSKKGWGGYRIQLKQSPSPWGK